MKNDVLLLISEDLLKVQKSIENTDLIKGRESREGLIQQIVTYVRDGRTVTRKQWVRSEFAEHAKKNEEQKRLAELKRKDKDKAREKRLLMERNEKARNQDKKAAKKKEKQKEEMLGNKPKKKELSDLDKQRKKLQSQRKQEDKERKKKDRNRNKTSNKDKKETEYSSFGQKERTKAENKAREKLLHTDSQ